MIVGVASSDHFSVDPSGINIFNDIYQISNEGEDEKENKKDENVPETWLEAPVKNKGGITESYDGRTRMWQLFGV